SQRRFQRTVPRQQKEISSSRMKHTTLVICLLGTLTYPAYSVTEAPDSAGACGPASVNCTPGATSASTATITLSTSTPAWQAELDKAEKTGDACKEDVAKYCDGIQVGEGRLQACLKAHRSKLSKNCKAVQGWR